jgi:hypothetical protein
VAPKISLPAKVTQIVSRVQLNDKITRVLSKVRRKKRKRKRNDLGKVVNFVTQKIKECSEAEGSESKKTDNFDLAN